MKNKVKSLMDSGLDKSRFRRRVQVNQLYWKFYTTLIIGLFALESEAIDSIANFFNPYTGESIEVED